jgi:hypothetical protein
MRNRFREVKWFAQHHSLSEEDVPLWHSDSTVLVLKNYIPDSTPGPPFN